MKKLILLLFSVIFLSTLINAQDYEEMVSRCALGVGDNTTYLKDFVIRLPEGISQDDSPVHKASIYLMKGQNYRFTMCNSEETRSELILTVYDRSKMLISTYDKKTGNIVRSFDFACNKTGLYQLWYTFKEGESGSGVGIVSLVK
ncbi:MAG: hypothetical protein LC649_09355 [Bacteroidales bacterium]|nr:hypothetical protein [Bacteroidales bacterium]